MRLKFIAATFLLITAESLVLAAIGYKVALKTGILGAETKVTGLNRESFTQPQSQLQNFFEIAPFAQKVVFDPDWLETSARYQINSQGFNNSQEFAIEKPKNTTRIAAIGDSFTFGLFVNTENSYPQLLASQLNNDCQKTTFEVINLGVPTYDIEYAVERFRLRGAKYNPDLVLWFLKDDDFAHIQNFLKPYITLYFNEAQNNLGATQANLLAWDRALEEQNKTYNPSQLLEFQENALSKMNDYYDLDLLVFTYPFTQENYKKLMNDFAGSRANIFFWDGLPDLNELNLVFADKHPTAEGYQLISTAVFNFLKDKNLINC